VERSTVLPSSHAGSNAHRFLKHLRLKRLRKNTKQVPRERLNLAQDGILGCVQKSGSVPKGRLKAAQNMELAEFQPSLRDYSSSINLPRITSWAKFNRPFGTFADFLSKL
jgi:hypothetical protein